MSKNGEATTLKSGKTGGVLVGRKHSECNSEGDCGIKTVVKGSGQPIEMEAGEVVITAPAVNDNDTHEFDGQKLSNRQILSKINEQGGGVKLAEGGVVFPTMKTGGILSKLSDYEQDVLQNLSFGKVRYRVVKDLSNIGNILSEGFGYVIHGQAGKELHATKKGIEAVRAMPKHTLNIKMFKKGGLVEPTEMEVKSNRDLQSNSAYKGVNHNYKNPYELNKAIEALLDSVPSSELSDEEKTFISYYSGYGGLQAMTSEEHGVMDEYYTPDKVCKYMWALAYQYGFKPENAILEPSCGTGNFIKYAPDKSRVHGYEINPYSAKIAQVLYPSAHVKVESFEQNFIYNNMSTRGNLNNKMQYGLVIGNPPYGTYNGLYAGMGEKAYTKAHNWIDYFIFRGLDLLYTGGLLVYIIGSSVKNGGVPFLAQQKTKAKEAIAEKSILVDAYRLPEGIFERTEVVTDIIVLRKR